MKILFTLLTAVLMLSGSIAMAEESPVAEVYGKNVYTRDLSLPEKMLEQSKSSMSSEDFAQWKQDSLRQMLAYSVMEEARKRFLKEIKMEPTQEDIDGYIAFLHRAKIAEREKRAVDKDKLHKELEQADLNEERKTNIKTQLSQIDDLDKFENLPLTEAMLKETQESEQTVAVMLVSSWKFNQALYQKYAGRVVFQQFGLEPIDAHKKFMQELSTTGAYKILDPAYENLFKETNEYFNKKFDYVDKAEADKYFASPWWLSE